MRLFPALVAASFGLSVCGCGSSGGTETEPVETVESESVERPTKAGPPAPREDDPPAEVAEPTEHDAPAEGVAPIAPAIGQWIRYGADWREGGRSTVEYRIVDREDGAFWVEVTDVRRERTRQVKMLVRPGATVDDHQVLQLSFENRGEIEEIPSRLLPTYQPLLQQWLGMLFPAELAGEREDVTVPAGVFHGAFKTERELTFGQAEVTANVWLHPAVPISGMVRFEGGSGGHTLQLLGFGLEGAESRFGR
jgi:hypothetical protein